MPKKTLLILLLFSITVLALLFINRPNSQKSVTDDLRRMMRPEPRELTAFTLVDQNNQEFKLDRFAGSWSFVFFGYTYCPDICPTTLSTLASVFSQFEKSRGPAQNMNVFFISVDPQRDNPEKLAGYMTYFNKTFMGVTGKKQQIDDFARQFGAGYIIELEREPGDYLVSHTSSIFLVDPKMRILAHFSSPHDPEIIASQFERIRVLQEQ